MLPEGIMIHLGDEDFTLLLTSMIKTEDMIKNDLSIKNKQNLKKVIFFITGKGPMSGNARSHSVRATRRVWNTNLQKYKINIK